MAKRYRMYCVSYKIGNRSEKECFINKRMAQRFAGGIKKSVKVRKIG